MPEEVVVLIALGMAFSLAWGVLGFIKTIAIKKLEARGGGDTEALRHELNELHRRLEALEDGTLVRLQEVEERVDFAERLLASQRDAARIKE